MTRYKQRTAPLMALLVLLGLCLVWLPMRGAALAASDKVDISTGEYTKYYMTIPTNGMTAHMFDKQQHFKGMDGFHLFARSNHTVTLQLVFNAVKYKDPQNNVTYSVMVSKATTLNFPALWSFGHEVRFLEDLKINIRESFYRYFTEEESDADFSNVSIFVILGQTKTFGIAPSAVAVGAAPFTISGVSFEKAASDTDPNDPNSPDFELGDNGGSLIEHQFSSFWTKVWDWLKRNWKTLLYVLLGLIAFGFVASFIRWILGK